MKRILCLWLPNWPIQRRLRLELSRKGIVLYEMLPAGGQRVTHVSAAAARLGAKPGMALADATARWQNRLLFEKSEPIADSEEITALASGLNRFSPLVGLEDAERPESLLLDITGIAALFGSEMSLANAVAEAIAAKRLSCRIAVADTVGAAWAVSHYGNAEPQEPILLPPGCSDAHLAHLPAEALRLSQNTLNLLSEFGLQTVGDLLRLPRESLTSRAGPELRCRLDQALGTRPEPIVAINTCPDLAAAWDFEHPCDQAEVIDSVMQHLCALVADKLHDIGHGAGELCCKLRCESSADVSFAVGFFEPTASADEFHELLQLQLERVSLPAAVACIALQATSTSPLRTRQRELFPDEARAHERQLPALINRLAVRLGRAAVVRPVPRADAQPELSWREEPLLQGAAKKRRRRKPSPARLAFHLLQRPLFLFRPPVEVEVTAVLPDGPPARFVYRNAVYRVACHVGPERIETGWWRKRGVRRDYYRVETEGGERFWLFRTLDNGRWFLHGEFA